MLHGEGVGASARAIRSHYDIGNEFFALWLDSEMVYSCALFEEGDTLDAAQMRKLDYHISETNGAGKRAVLDIGCGWGALLRRLAANDVTTSTGLTLSEAQASKIEDEACAGIVVRRENWRDHRPDHPYDAMISIGAFEHFARPNLDEGQRLRAYREFFDFCHANLVRQGRLSLQTIVYSYERAPALNIFPESDLPFIWEILHASTGRFELIKLRNDRRDYVRTCRAWAKRLSDRRNLAVRLVGEEVTQEYERYLAVAAAAFKVGTLCLARLTFQRIEPAGAKLR